MTAPIPKQERTGMQMFEDLRPGSTVQVVTPILRSGGYLVPSVRQSQSGTAQEIQAGDDFLGYEKSTYKVVPRRDGGVRVRFVRTMVWQNGKATRSPRPRLPLFAEVERYRHVRIVYLIRVSKADHNMAILAANDLRSLQALTTAVTEKAACHNDANALCKWVPQGVAVTPDEA